MRILVTGGAGFVGSHLVRELLRDSHSVCILDNLYRGSQDTLQGLAVDFIEGDIRDYACVRGAVSGAEVVYHLAAQSNVLGAVQDMDYAFSTNLLGTYHVLKAAAETGVRRLVFTSSREVYGQVDRLPVPETAPLNPKNSYGVSKAAGELYCRLFSNTTALEIVILRLANVYGPGDRDRVIPIFISNALTDRPLVIYGGGKLLDFIWIQEAVQCLIRAAERPVAGRIINVGAGRPIDLTTVAGAVLRLTKSNSPIELAPARPAEVDRFAADIATARAVLDHEPEREPLSHLHQVVAAVLATGSVSSFA